MPFEKMSFDEKFNFREYLTLKDSKKTLGLKGLDKKENYSVNLALKLKSKGEYYFWNNQLKTNLKTPYTKGKNYSLAQFLPPPLKKDFLKIRASTSHRSLILVWMDWQFNQDLNKHLLFKKPNMTDTDFKKTVSSNSKSLSSEKIIFGDLIFLHGTDDIDSQNEIAHSMIYFGNGVVLEQLELNNKKSIMKLSYLKDVIKRYESKILDLKVEYRRLKNNLDFNLYTKMQEIKQQDQELDSYKMEASGETL
ncbi:MAG: hypothetical protein L6Q37_06730, partial [Bdellovibrionaceae bacterium]|nr:hypothetical protein [Pseudobdellovibrionaceae bacterium]